MIRKYQHLVNSPSYHMLQGPAQSLAGMQIKLVTCPFSYLLYLALQALTCKTQYTSGSVF